MPESRLTLPADITDALSLRRTIASIIREVDIITGAKGVDPYVRQSQLPEPVEQEVEVGLDSIVSLREELTRISDSIIELSGELETLESTVQNLSDALDNFNNVKQYVQAPAAMLDFDDQAWTTNFGLFQLTSLGADFVNPPEAMDPAITYTVYLLSSNTLNGGASHEVVIEDTTNAVTKVYRRVGDTAATTISNGWLI